MASFQPSIPTEEAHERLGPPATPALSPTHSPAAHQLIRSSSTKLQSHRSSHWPNWSSFDCTSCDSSYSATDPRSAEIPASSENLLPSQMHSAGSHPGGGGQEMVPFKWEEAPGLPIDKCCSYELASDSPTSLQLPPKLQRDGNQSPWSSFDKSQAFQESPLVKPMTLPITSNSNQRFERLRKFMRTPASSARPSPPPFSHSLNHRPPSIELSSPNMQQDPFDFHDRFFFDKHSPRELGYGASMNSIIPIFDASDGEQDELYSETALRLLAVEKCQDTERSSDSSPWQLFNFYRMDDTASPYWQPASCTKIQRISLQHDEDDNENDDSFHDFFSSGTSVKPSQRTDDTSESGSSSPTTPSTPWYLSFGPEEEEMHAENRGRRLVVRFVALIRLKGVISRFKRRRRGAYHHQFGETTMWSPTLATYLHNQQLEEEEEITSKQIFTTGSANIVDNNGHSKFGSNKLQINPNYYLPPTIRTHFLSPNHHTYSDGHEDENDKDDIEDHYDLKSDAAKDSFLVQEEEVWNNNLRRRKLSLGAQLAEFDDDELSPRVSAIPAEPLGIHTCRGICKVRKTVKVVVSTIKVFLIHTEIGKRKATQRSF